MANEDSAIFPVTLNVYDLSQGLARQLSAAILGTSIDAIYHTGVVVYGREYWFGNGIEQGIPGRTYFGPPLRTLKLGDTSIPEELFHEYLQSIREQFNPSTYNLMRNNCNHFSDEVSQFLVGLGIPKEILELPNTVLNSPQGPLIASMLQGMENSLRNGRAPGFPLPVGAPQASQVSQPMLSSAPTRNSPANSAKPLSTPSVQRYATQAQSCQPAAQSVISEKLVAKTESENRANRAPTAKELLEEEIKREFAVLMALGNLGANEAAAEALRRVVARQGSSTRALS